MYECREKLFSLSIKVLNSLCLISTSFERVERDRNGCFTSAIHQFFLCRVVCTRGTCRNVAEPEIFNTCTSEDEEQGDSAAAHSLRRVTT